MSHIRLAASIARNARMITAPDGAFLSEDEMRLAIPSVFATEAHASRSERYTYIPTIEILRGLAREGFRPTFACQSVPRAADKVGYTKHLLRLRRVDAPTVGDVPEIVGLNSHGGETAFQLFGGVYRSICLNGMVCGQTYDEVRVRHSGRIVDDVIEAAYRVVDMFGRVDGEVETMKAIVLSRDEQLAFAESAAEIRLATAQGERPAITAEQFNMARRPEDEGADLWRTFNRVQENATRGGLHGVLVDVNGRDRRMTTRPVTGIDGNVKLNRALWTLANEIAEMKSPV